MEGVAVDGVGAAEEEGGKGIEMLHIREV
jgi:hypothetical protein